MYQSKTLFIIKHFQSLLAPLILPLKILLMLRQPHFVVMVELCHFKDKMYRYLYRLCYAALIEQSGQIARQAGVLLRMLKWFFNRDFNYLQRKLNDEV